jgi:hypothetical protein
MKKGRTQAARAVIDIDDVLGDLTWIPVGYNGNAEAFQVGYDLASISLDDFDRFRALKDEEDQSVLFHTVTQALIGVRFDWNVHRRGEKIPTTSEGLRSAPLPMLLAAFDAIMGDQSPKEAKSAT